MKNAVVFIGEENKTNNELFQLLNWRFKVMNTMIQRVFLLMIYKRRKRKQLSQYQYEGKQQEFMEKVHKAIVEFDVDFLQGIK